MEPISRCVLTQSLGLCLTNPRADMGSSDPIPQFSYLVRQFKKHNLAYLHVTEPRVGGNLDVDAPPESSNDFLRQIWCEDGKDRVFISAGGYTRQTAIETAEEKGGMVAFGRLYIPNVSPWVLGIYPVLRFRVCCCTDIPSYLSLPMPVIHSSVSPRTAPLYHVHTPLLHNYRITPIA